MSYSVLKRISNVYKRVKKFYYFLPGARARAVISYTLRRNATPEV